MVELGEALQGYPLSYRQVADRSDGLVSAPTVGNVIRDANRNPSDNTFAGLALALDVDETLLRKAWKAGEQQEWTLPAKFQRLDVDGWERLLEFGDFLLGQQRKPGR
jgi:transcriptional regulator with XRE-family HTH domain